VLLVFSGHVVSTFYGSNFKEMSCVEAPLPSAFGLGPQLIDTPMLMGLRVAVDRKRRLTSSIRFGR